MSIKSDKLIYVFSDKTLVLTVAYFVFILLAGLIVSICTILKISTIKTEDILLYTITSSIAVCGMLCSIQYIKRIYKASMEKRICTPTDGDKSHFGNLLYFFLRPVFSFVFIVIIIFSILSALYIITDSSDFILNIRFLYLCVIISSFVGYSIGHILDKFEILSSHKINETFDKLSVNKGENDNGH